MKSNRAVLTAIVVVIVLAAGWWLFHRGSSASLDLIGQFDAAKRQGGDFTVIDATLAGRREEGDRRAAQRTPHVSRQGAR